MDGLERCIGIWIMTATGHNPLPWLRLALDHERCSLDGKRLARVFHDCQGFGSLWIGMDEADVFTKSLGIVQVLSRYCSMPSSIFRFQDWLLYIVTGMSS